MPFIAAAVSAISAAFTAAAATTIGSILIKVAITTGLTLLARALTPKPKVRETGIQTTTTTSGGTEPQRFVIGKYATSGHIVAPPYSHTGGVGFNQTPNAYLNYIIEVSNLPGVSLSRIIVDDDYSQIGTTADPTYGSPLLGQRRDGVDYAWIKFYDGNQIAADPMLVDKYGAHPDRPWTSTSIGRGNAYAVLTFLYNRKVFNNLPAVRFEINGIPLYDPRQDSSVGGSGSQRWADKATWVYSDNPVVMIYNIMRGLTIGNGNVYGGSVDASALPLDNWFTAMNACDVYIGARKSFTAGFEVDVTAEPAQIIEELLKTCLGQICEYGGVFRIRVGAPSAAVYFMTDDDIVITDPQELDPFPGLESTYNAISGQYPEPNSMWQGRQAVPIYNATWEAEDGNRRLPIELNFPAVSDNSQVAQLMTAYIKDQRRFRVHRLVLPPDAAILEPLDTISWTSARNGYSSKIFEVVELTDRVDTVCQEILVRERDPSDYSWTTGNDLPKPPDWNGNPSPNSQAVAGFAVSAFIIKDSAGINRKPGIKLEWTPSAATDSDLVRYEVRLAATSEIIKSGTASTETGFVIVSDNLVPSTIYQARAQYIVDRPVSWTSWVSVTTPAIFISEYDIGADAVGTGNLQNNAVTIPSGFFGSSPAVGVGLGSYLLVASVNINLDFNGSIIVSYTASQGYGAGLRGTATYMKLNGTVVDQVSSLGAITTSVAMSYQTALPAGLHLVEILWEGQDSTVTQSYRSLVVTGLKK